MLGGFHDLVNITKGLAATSNLSVLIPTSDFSRIIGDLGTRTHFSGLRVNQDLGIKRAIRQHYRRRLSYNSRQWRTRCPVGLLSHAR